MTYAEMHERLLAWASAEERKGSLLAARAAWFERFGEPHEEDRSYESRMNALLDFYLYDFRADGVDTTLEAFLRAGDGLATDELSRFRELAGNIHSLFEVRRMKPGEVRLRDVLSRQDHDVLERQNARHVVHLADRRDAGELHRGPDPQVGAVEEQGVGYAPESHALVAERAAERRGRRRLGGGRWRRRRAPEQRAGGEGDGDGPASHGTLHST